MALIFAAAFEGSLRAQEIPPKKYSVLVSAFAWEVTEGGPTIFLNWPADSAATSYTISRRTLDRPWQQLRLLPGTATNLYDSSVIVGTKYEYQLIKQTSAGYTGYGYISAGIKLPLQNFFGKVILVVENSLATPLAAELARLEEDIRGEGWDVVRRNVAVTDSPQMVKARIKEIYDADPTRTRAVFLIGHVPVPYSGNIAPDEHPNHQGAWPADVYYADMDGVWTDSTVNTTTAERQSNWNLPGDGKFDQSEIPSTVELWVGRVDLSSMTCYANKPNARSELDLTRQYLNKNHAFRWGQKIIQRRALVCDNFSDKGTDPIGGSAWRNFPAFVGADNIVEVGWDGYLPAATSGSYLWSFASGGGSYYYSSGVATSDDFALQDVRVVFAMFMGSYFGDWNNESNFLRASLGSGDILAASYSGFPQALYFPMGSGEPIGYGIALAQNNAPGGLYPPWGQGTHLVHISLHGDPTLRMHPVIPPSNVTAQAFDGIRVQWEASPDRGLMGYEVFRKTSATTAWAKISGSSFVAGSAFYDPTGNTTYSYRVRAVKLEDSWSGSYLNASQPVVATYIAGPVAPAAPSNLRAIANSPTQITLQWADNSNDESGFRIFFKAGASGTYQSLTVAANTTSYAHSSRTPGTTYFYKMVAFNDGGNSAETPEISVTTPASGTASTATFVKTDATSSGSWKGKYGYDGGLAPYGDFVPPAYVQINAYLNYPHTWENPSTDPAALEKRTSTARFATAWQHSAPFYFYLQFKDTAVHRVSFYFLDWENLGRQQKVEFFDYSTGQLLGSTTVANFANGVYSIWDLKGKVTVKISALGVGTAVMSGIFFDPQIAPVANSAAFVSSDTSTSGSWKGKYGGEGGLAPYGDFLVPSYVQINAYLNYSTVWENPSTDPAALQKRTSTARFATAWQHTAPFFFYLQFKDTAVHRVSFYFLDWETFGRQQKIEFFDYVTGQLLGSTTVANFANGVYSTWNLKGKVTVKVSATGPGSAVMSGIFFDGATTSPNAVRYLAANSTTQGNWKGTFGAQGYQLAGDATSLPAGVTLALSGKSDHVWNYSTSATAALQKATTTDRIAACWYAPENFEVAVNVTGGTTRKVSFYSLDWDLAGRSQRIDVLDGSTGAILHTTNLSAFGNGVYHSYDVKGSLKFRFTRTGPANAVVSAIFIDAASGSL